jgi:hypothetical protein
MLGCDGRESADMSAKKKSNFVFRVQRRAPGWHILRRVRSPVSRRLGVEQSVMTYLEEAQARDAAQLLNDLAVAGSLGQRLQWADDGKNFNRFRELFFPGPQRTRAEEIDHWGALLKQFFGSTP